MSKPSRTRWLFVRFLFVGLLNTAFGYGTFLLLLWTGLSSQIALIGAWIMGVLFSFRTIRTLVFTGHNGRIGRFVTVYLVMLALNWSALLVLEARGAPAWLAQGALTFVVALVSFAAQKIFVFSPEISS